MEGGVDIAGLQAKWLEHGYLVLPGFVALSSIDELKQRMQELITAFEATEDYTIFSTKEQATKTTQYFLESGDKIRYFFEEKAFDATGSLQQDKRLSINKVGHALHDLDPVFSRFSRTPQLEQLAKLVIGFRQPKLIQSMYIFKQPRIGGEVAPHQDSTFLYTDPPSVVAFWFALEDATKENGCLWVLPGSHKLPLARRFVREGTGVTFHPLKTEDNYESSKYIPLECSAGSLVLMHGNLLHLSHENKSDVSRHAYTFHVIEGESTYPSDNWLQRSADMPAHGFSDFKS